MASRNAPPTPVPAVGSFLRGAESLEGMRGVSKLQPPVSCPVHSCHSGWTPLFSSFYPSQISFFLNTPFFGKASMTLHLRYAGSGARIPLSPGDRGPPCGLAVAAHLICAFNPRPNVRVPNLLGCTSCCRAASSYEHRLSHSGFGSQLHILLAVCLEISHFTFLCLFSFSV